MQPMRVRAIFAGLGMIAFTAGVLILARHTSFDTDVLAGVAVLGGIAMVLIGITGVFDRNGPSR